MKYTQFFFACITLLAANVKQTSQLQEVSMDTYNMRTFSLLQTYYGSSSSMILKAYQGSGSGYLTATTKTLLISAPRGYGLFVAIRELDLRPKEQDRLLVSIGKDSFTYSNTFLFSHRQSFPEENFYKHYSPGGLINVTFVTDGSYPSFYNYDGFQLVFTVHENQTKCSTTQYKNLYFRCNNGRCISQDFKCDGHNHCGDQSDQNYFCHTDPINIRTNSQVVWIAGGIIFAVIGVACATYIIIRRVSPSSTSTTETVITHPPPTQISYPPYPHTGAGYPQPPPYPQTGAGYPAPPPPYHSGINNPGYH